MQPKISNGGGQPTDDPGSSSEQLQEAESKTQKQEFLDSLKSSPTILLVTYLFALAGFISLFTPDKSFGILASLVGVVLGVISAIKSREDAQYKRNSIIAAVICLLMMFGCAAMSPSSSTSSTADASSTSSDSSSPVATASSETTSGSPTPDPQLTQAQQTLQSKITEANNLLTSSENQVADDSTRTALSQAITTAQAISSDSADTYTAATQTLQSAMDAVQSSESQKQAADAAAQQAAEQQAQEQAQQQATQNSEQQSSQSTQNAQTDTQSSQTQTGTSASTDTKPVKRGAFCSSSKVGQQAPATNGGTVTCTSEGERARWK